MTDSRAAKRYARALFNAAQKQNAATAVNDDLTSITSGLASSPKVKEFVFSPVTSDKDKKELFAKAFDGKVNDLTGQLLQLLVKKGREAEIFAIQLEFAALKRDNEGIVKALIESAFPLSDDQQKAVLGKVAESTGRTVDPEFNVNASLLGGVRVTYDNFVLDGTARGSLNRIKESLLYDLLKQS
jgi:F-type H+-transporting ATPase subunit delta